MIVSSKKLNSVKEYLDNGSLGDYMMKSFREQRKNKILCDVVVQSGGKEFYVHKSVLYAYSLYCRKLFTGSFPPPTKNGIVVIDLNCFSENVVQVLINLMYGDKEGEIVDIDVEELIKLTDFLQADCDIKLMTEILRNLLNGDNCLELYKLACTFHFHNLQTVIVTYISENARPIISSDEWKDLDETTVFSILKHPAFQSNSTWLGGALKFYYSRNDGCNILIGINTDYKYHIRTKVCYHKEDNDDMAYFRHSLRYESCQLYFVYRKDFYSIEKRPRGIEFLYKYSKYRKRFYPVHGKTIRLENMKAHCVLDDDENDRDVTVMYVPVDQEEEADEESNRFVLVTLSIVHCPYSRIEKVEKEYIDATFNVNEYKIIWNRRSKKIYFFNGRNVHIYDMNYKAFVENLSSLNTGFEDDTLYTAFDIHIFAVTHDGSNVRMYILKETALCWELYLEQEMQLKIGSVESCQSSTELVIILESSDDRMDHIYKLNTDSKTLAFFKTTCVMGKYLFLPEHIHS